MIVATVALVIDCERGRAGVCLNPPRPALALAPHSSVCMLARAVMPCCNAMPCTPLTLTPPPGTCAPPSPLPSRPLQRMTTTPPDRGPCLRYRACHRLTRGAMGPFPGEQGGHAWDAVAGKMRIVGTRHRQPCSTARSHPWQRVPNPAAMLPSPSISPHLPTGTCSRLPPSAPARWTTRTRTRAVRWGGGEGGH